MLVSVCNIVVSLHVAVFIGRHTAIAGISISSFLCKSSNGLVWFAYIDCTQ